VNLGLAEFWVHRELLYFLVWRDLKVRYKQTVLGALWSIIQPVFTMLIFTLFFGRLAKMPSDGIPYPVFSYAGLLPWGFFAQGLMASTNSLVGNSQLIKKVYFPRLIIPVASVLSGLPDFLIAFGVLLILMWHYAIAPTLNVVWLPFLLALALITSLGVGLWLSALNAQFRDIRHTLGFITQIWMFATPIVYPSSLIRGTWKTIYGLNPMASVVEGFRAAMLGVPFGRPAMLIASVASALALLFGGAYYFRRMERQFSDTL
jgi:lipopolysaccharide transport system permease protein